MKSQTPGVSRMGTIDKRTQQSGSTKSQDKPVTLNNWRKKRFKIIISEINNYYWRESNRERLIWCRVSGILTL